MKLAAAFPALHSSVAAREAAVPLALLRFVKSSIHASFAINSPVLYLAIRHRLHNNAITWVLSTTSQMWAMSNNNSSSLPRISTRRASRIESLCCRRPERELVALHPV